VNGLSFRVIESVHCVDAGEHAHSVEADDGEGEGHKQADPQTDAHELATEPARAETGAGNVKHLKLDENNIRRFIF
jgi:hypothetical protein